MKNSNKSNEKLVSELQLLRQKLRELEASSSEYQRFKKKISLHCSHLEQLVKSRAAELEETQEKLNKELAERQRAEQAFHKAESQLKASLFSMKQHNQEITLLSEMGEALQACLTTEEAVSVITRYLKKMFPEERGALYMITDSKKIIEAVVTWGETVSSELVFSREDCWAFRKGHTHLVDKPGTGDLCRHLNKDLLGGYICTPMMAQGNAIGMLHLQKNPDYQDENQKTWEGWGQDKKRLAAAVAEQLALALANLKLQETLRDQAIHDPLTGLFNRRYMMETLERDILRAARAGTDVGVIMLDLDHFKDFNDNYGHDAGDALLREIGAFLKSNVRGEDVVCRYGGEEFILVMPEASLNVLQERARLLWEGIKSLEVRYAGQYLPPITVSIGLAISPKNCQDGIEIIKMADAALYRAKEEGRNRIVIAEK